MKKASGLPQNTGFDEQLWMDAQEGDHGALNRLIAHYDHLVVRLCGSYRAAGMERDDLLQEAYLGLLKAIRSFRPEKGISFSAFAGLCIKRQLISAVRRQNADKSRPLNDSVPLEETELSGLPSDWRQSGPEAAVILEEESRRMREQVIALLSPLEKETLQLYLKGFSYEEMAKKLKCPEKSVDNALQRIRRKLRKVQSRGNL
ncbi:MAG: sigma-70 family RNA polymerase sigma factor [Oscillospiraceae bacterium]|nr:sigma-70 family RNA polymerase sigma factor [Oscillospiraceae bacterium]